MSNYKQLQDLTANSNLTIYIPNDNNSKFTKYHKYGSKS